jgi:hypothetical protein
LDAQKRIEQLETAGRGKRRSRPSWKLRESSLDDEPVTPGALQGDDYALGDLHQLHRQFEFWGISIESVQKGKADSLDVALQGIYNSVFITNVREQVRRGMAGLVERGLHPGGRAYGYCAVQGAVGTLKIVEDEAAIIRRIFHSYVNGKTPREIAKELNRERVIPWEILECFHNQRQPPAHQRHSSKSTLLRRDRLESRPNDQRPNNGTPNFEDQSEGRMDQETGAGT